MSEVVHRMIGGSHERPTGSECRCGAEWDWWNETCTALIKGENELGQGPCLCIDCIDGNKE